MKNTESDEATGPLDNMVKSSPFQGGVSGSLPERATLTNELKSIMISTYRKYGDEKALLIKGKRFAALCLFAHCTMLQVDHKC